MNILIYLCKVYQRYKAALRVEFSVTTVGGLIIGRSKTRITYFRLKLTPSPPEVRAQHFLGYYFRRGKLPDSTGSGWNAQIQIQNVTHERNNYIPHALFGQCIEKHRKENVVDYKFEIRIGKKANENQLAESLVLTGLGRNTPLA